MKERVTIFDEGVRKLVNITFGKRLLNNFNLKFKNERAASGQHQLVVHNDRKSNVSEAYRILITNLNFKNIDRNLKSLVITSSTPAEGKSTTTANLALALAQSGKKVILVDTDLRRPTLHKIFNLNVMNGLSNSLVEGIDPLSLCQRFNDSNLRLITAGPLPPNPSDMLGSGRMRVIIERLKEDADFVLFDCPPTLGFNDSLVLASAVDGYLIVVAAGTTPKQAIKQTKAQLEKVGANIVGTILNGVDINGSNYYYSN